LQQRIWRLARRSYPLFDAVVLRVQAKVMEFFLLFSKKKGLALKVRRQGPRG
jgi:hypothetical protein